MRFILPNVLKIKHFDYFFLSWGAVFLFLHYFLFFLSLFQKQKYSNVCSGWTKGKLENVNEIPVSKV